jgi:hypothetical protein
MKRTDFEASFNINKSLSIVGLLLLIVYGIYNSRNLIFGPGLQILTPAPNSTVDEKIIEVKGRVKNATIVKLNDRPIFIDKDGYFTEKVLLYSGFNIIKIEAKDRFKQEEEEIIKVYYKPQ